MSAGAPRIRRIVTGEADGVSTFAAVEEVSPLVADAFQYFNLWGWDEQPVLPVGAAASYEARSLYPPPGGLRLRMAYFPPEGWVDERPEAERRADAEAVAALRDAEPRFRASAEPRGEGPLGYHRTDTIDILVVVQGAITLSLADGGEEVLRPGDCAVQNGTFHSWRAAAEGCLLALIQIPAERVEP